MNNQIETKEALIQLQETLRGKVEHAEAWFNFGLSMASMVGVVIIPLIPASLTFMSVASEFPRLLHIPQGMAYFVGAITAVGLEFLALLTIRTALRMLKYNQEALAFNKHPELRPDEHLQMAPASQGVTASAIYTVIVLSLVVLLKIYPSMVLWALIPMSLMALVAEWAFLLSVDQSERELRRRQAEVTKSRVDELAELNIVIEQLNSRIEQADAKAAAHVEHVQSLMAEHAGKIEQMNAEHAQSLAITIEQLEAKHVEHVQSLAAAHDEQISQFQSSGIEQAKHVQRLERENARLAAQLEALRIEHVQRKIEQPAIEQAEHVQPKLNTSAEHVQSDIEQPKLSKVERQRQLLHILTTEFNGQPSDELNKSAIGDRLGVKHTTIGRDIEELIAANRLAVNGHIEVLS